MVALWKRTCTQCREVQFRAMPYTCGFCLAECQEGGTGPCVRYCSTKCCAEHWDEHKARCPKSSHRYTCSWCDANVGQKLKACAGCTAYRQEHPSLAYSLVLPKSPYYCSRSCQKSHWSNGHRDQCLLRFFGGSRTEVPTDASSLSNCTGATSSDCEAELADIVSSDCEVEVADIVSSDCEAERRETSSIRTFV